MDIDFSDLLNNIDEDIELTEEQFLELAQKITLDVQADLVKATPVDTGRARQGWQAETPKSINENGIVENNVEYIAVLNDGSSKQAPANFVENVVARYDNGGDE
jgi:hypothetical protein